MFIRSGRSTREDLSVLGFSEKTPEIPSSKVFVPGRVHHFIRHTVHQRITLNFVDVGVLVRWLRRTPRIGKQHIPLFSILDDRMIVLCFHCHPAHHHQGNQCDKTKVFHRSNYLIVNYLISTSFNYRFYRLYRFLPVEFMGRRLPIDTDRLS